jgi:uncharacterized protein with HEPN domain
MLEAAEKAAFHVHGRSREDFEHDEILQLALIRLLEVVGEAAAHVPPALQEQVPGVPWPDVVNMRHRLIHGYDRVDPEVVWQTLQNDIPALIDALKDALAERVP